MKPIIDVSKHNGVLDWQAIKPQIDTAILRIGYRSYAVKGNIIKDSQFDYNEAECYRLLIPREYYYFPQELTVSECAEAAIWLSYNLIIYKDLPISIWLDSEKAAPAGKTGRADNLSKSVRTNMLLTLRDFLRTLMPSWKIGIYASDAWVKDHLDYTMIRENDIPLWIARYNGMKKGPSYPYQYWQYSSNGALKGAGCCFDFSVRNGEKIDH